MDKEVRSSPHYCWYTDVHPYEHSIKTESDHWSRDGRIDDCPISLTTAPQDDSIDYSWPWGRRLALLWGKWIWYSIVVTRLILGHPVIFFRGVDWFRNGSTFPVPEITARTTMPEDSGTYWTTICCDISISMNSTLQCSTSRSATAGSIHHKHISLWSTKVTRSSYLNAAYTLFSLVVTPGPSVDIQFSSYK